MLITDTLVFNEGQEYDLHGPNVELQGMTCLMGERSRISGLASDFARREDQGDITLFCLWSSTITAHEGRRVEAEIDPRYIESLAKDSGRFEHYNGLMRRFGK